MTKKKTKHTAKKELKTLPDFNLIYEPERKLKVLFYALIILISVFLSVYYLYNANAQNHGNGFPLDDPWIHLTFAKNLVEYHSFSYFKNEMATSGSTSPVYTFLLSLFFIVSKNEMFISYILGIIFLVLSALFFYKINSFEFPRENIYALGLTAVFLADKWMNFISGSGMETTMFIFILISCTYFYKTHKVIPFSVFLGLIMWSRPDGIAFIGALILDYLWRNYVQIKTTKDKFPQTFFVFSKKELIKIVVIAGIIVIPYFILNLYLSGSLLPNTYTAKLAYYSPEFRSRADFFKLEVWGYFTSGAYAIVMVGFLISVMFLVYDIFRKKYNPNLIYILFIFALVFIYWLKLPYAHRFGRYLMPVIPFFLLSSASGLKNVFILFGTYFKERTVAVSGFLIILAIMLVMSVMNYIDNKKNYADECKYISDRQIAAALWLKENTQESDIVATHDVGAIGYYCNRKIVDVAGLVTPELIDKINDREYVNIMTDYMNKNNVSYLAFLRQWYRVSGQNPLWTTADSLPPEEMDIYKYIPGKTHILSREANSIIMHVINLISNRDPRQALQWLNKLSSIEPNSSLVYFWSAYAFSTMNDRVNFEKSLQKALEIFPDYKDALFLLGYYYKNTGKYDEARKNFEKCLKIKPGDSRIIKLMEEIPPDSLKPETK